MSTLVSDVADRDVANCLNRLGECLSYSVRPFLSFAGEAPQGQVWAARVKLTPGWHGRLSDFERIWHFLQLEAVPWEEILKEEGGAEAQKHAAGIQPPAQPFVMLVDLSVGHGYSILLGVFVKAKKGGAAA